MILQVLTGVTGTLGANILNFLRFGTTNNKIARVICLVRAKNDEEARTRVEKALLYHRSYPQVISSTEIECIAAKLDQEDLGLLPYALDDIRQHATTIIHVTSPQLHIMADKITESII